VRTIFPWRSASNSSQFESDKRISLKIYHSFGEAEWPQAGSPSYGLKRRHKGWAGSSCSPKILRYGTTAMFPLLPLVLSASSCATATPTQNKNCSLQSWRSWRLRSCGKHAALAPFQGQAMRSACPLLLASRCNERACSDLSHGTRCTRWWLLRVTLCHIDCACAWVLVLRLWNGRASPRWRWGTYCSWEAGRICKVSVSACAH
jgi:hypothetical protein